MDNTSSLILLQDEMCQCPVIGDDKYLGLFPKLSSMHAHGVTQKQLCGVQSINKAGWF